ncbi:MAG: carbohydrate ABC transporter permease [Eubacteriales bacterium]|nr:carbohydrate ABC transporter permease [Eubacteriales bacterium]
MLVRRRKNKVRNSLDDRIYYVFCYAFCILLTLLVLYPLIYIVSCSFSSGQAVSSGKVFLWPVGFSLEGYRRVVTYDGIWRAYGNTLLYTVGGTLLHISLVMICAYPLARKGLPHKGFFMVFFTITMMFSGGLIPSYLLIRNLGMLNTIWVMLIPGAFSAYNMVVARTFIQNTIPDSLLEATQVDGCSDTLYFFRFVLPLSKAVIAVLSMQVAIGIWNSYFNAFIYLSNEKLYPLQILLRNILILSQISAEDLADPEEAQALQGMADLMKYALIVFSTVPILCVYPFVQKYFVKGIMIGSLKG